MNSSSHAGSDNELSQMEREIAATRAELDRTLDALQAKLSPRRRMRALMVSMHERTDAFSAYSGELVRGATNFVKRQPTPFIVATAAVIGAIVLARFLSRRD